MALAGLHSEQLQAGNFLALVLLNAGLNHQRQAAQKLINRQTGANTAQSFQAVQAVSQLILADGRLGKELGHQRMAAQLLRIGADRWRQLQQLLADGRGQRGLGVKAGAGQKAAHQRLLAQQLTRHRAGIDLGG